MIQTREKHKYFNTASYRTHPIISNKGLHEKCVYKVHYHYFILYNATTKPFSISPNSIKSKKKKLLCRK